MKKMNILNRMMALSLAAVLFITSPASAYAVDTADNDAEPTIETVVEDDITSNEEIEVDDSDVDEILEPAEEEQDDADVLESDVDESKGEELHNGIAGVFDENLEADPEEEADEADDADDADEEDEEECEHTDFVYEPNGNGTHKKICAECGEEVAEAEPCTFDENGRCELCGYEDPEHKITLTDANGLVEVTGTKAVLNGATKVVATEITEETDEAEFEKMTEALDEEAAKDNKSIVDFVAYDITLYDDNGDKVEVNRDAGNVTVVFKQLEVEGLNDSETSADVYHYDDAAVEEMKQVETVSDDTVQMITNHFSTYIVAIKGVASGLCNSDYVSIHNEETSQNFNQVKKAGTKNDRLLQVSVYVDGKLKESFPNSGNNKYYKTASDFNRANLVIEPKEGYVLNKVEGNEIYTKLVNGDFKKDEDPDGGRDNNKGFLVGALKNGNTVRIGLGRCNDKNNPQWITQVKVYLDSKTTLYEGDYGKVVVNKKPLGTADINYHPGLTGYDFRFYYVDVDNQILNNGTWPTGNNGANGFIFADSKIKLTITPGNDESKVIKGIYWGQYIPTSPDMKNLTNGEVKDSYEIELDLSSKREPYQRQMSIVLGDKEEDDIYLTANVVDYDDNTLNKYNVSEYKKSTNTLPGPIIFTNGNSVDPNEYSAPYVNPDTALWNKYNGKISDDGNKYVAYQGIVKDELHNNLPVFNYVMADVFNPKTTTSGITAYENSLIPFYKDSSGYYVLDSISELYKPGDQKKYYNKYTFDTDEKKMSRELNPDSLVGFWPMDESENEHNIHFGMDLQVHFEMDSDGKVINPSTGQKEDMKFEFAGDDDVWVFIDGKKVLDIGGIHKSVSGTINFANGTSVVKYGTSDGLTSSEVTKNLYGNAGIFNKSREEFAKTGHTLDIFYMERGGVESNCLIKFNFTDTSIVDPVDVAFKKTDENGANLAGAKFELYDNENCEGTAKYTATSSSSNGNNVVFTGVYEGTYYLKEVEAPEVTINGKKVKYALDEKVYKVVVTNGKKVYEKGQLKSTEAGSYEITAPDGTAVSEIKNYLNKKGTIVLTKIARDGVNVPDKQEKTEPLYKFKVERVISETQREAVTYRKENADIDGFPADYTEPSTGEHVEDGIAPINENDKTFLVYNEEIVTIPDLQPGKYVITEVEVTNSKSHYTLKDNFSTRFVVGDKAGETIKHGSDKVRSVEVEVTGDKTVEVKCENRLYKEESEDIKASNRKYVTKNADGTYNLTLDFTAPGKTTTTSETVAKDDTTTTGGDYDIVVVYDVSSSIANNSTAMDDGKTALFNMVKQVGEKAHSAQWKLIKFNRQASFVGPNNEWMSTDRMKTAVSKELDFDYDNRRNVVGGTNYQDAFEATKNALFDRKGRESREVIVIFITDGNPYGYGTGGNYTKNQTEGLNKGIEAVKKVKCNSFYSLGVGTSVSTSKLTQVTNSAGEECNPKPSPRQVITVNSYSAIAEGLSEVTTSISTGYSANTTTTTKYSSTATITDELSDFVDSNETKLTVVKGDDSTEVENASYDPKTKKIVATFTNTSPTGLGGGTYSVTLKIKPTKDAYVKYLESGYTDQGQKTTDAPDVEEANYISVGKNGFFSNNDGANVAFGDGTSLDYYKPVVQLDSVSEWKIVKVNATTKDALPNAEFKLAGQKTYYGKSNADGEVKWFESEADRNSENATTVTVDEGTYTLTETAAPAGFARSAEEWTVTVSQKDALSVKDSNGEDIAVVETKTQAGAPTKYVAVVTIENTVAYTLPETGGSGVYVYTIGGVLLMIGAALLLYKNKKNKNK